MSWERYGEAESESEKRESVELQPMFAIEISALLYISAIESVQQTTAAKLAAYISMIERGIHFWRSKAPHGSSPVTQNTDATG